MAPPEITLAIVGGPCGHRKAIFHQEKIHIGRGVSDAGDPADFSLDEDVSVSREQAVIIFEGGKYRIENRSKHKSTVINGRARDKSDIVNGDIIEVGSAQSRIEVRLNSSKSPDTADSPSKKNQQQMIWLGIGGLVLLLALVILGKIITPPPTPPPVGDAKRLALEARNAGDLNKAMSLLLPLIKNSDEYLEQYLKIKALSRRFESARHYEDVLQLDRALDEWRIIADEVLGKYDPLQTWVQTGQVNRLEQKLKEIGR